MRPSLLLAAALSTLPGPLPAQAAVEFLDAAPLSAPRLIESSGVLVSRRHPGLYWSVNDSGDLPILYATDSAGRDLGAVRLQGATNIDWEDLADGPCADGSPCLYVGDIGDNDRRRSHLVVYRLAEPAAPGGPSDAERLVPVLDSLRLVYPDGPHDAEAMAVTADGWLLIITKDYSGPPRLYRTAVRGAGSERRLERLGDLPIVVSLPRGRVVTGADVSPDGQWLVVRTYISLHLFRLEPGGRPAAVTGNFGLLIPLVEAQGEAVAFDGTGRLILTSERGRGTRGSIVRLRLHLPGTP